jgi:ribosomal protein S18 acetylase RimI-like enzyme
VPDQPYDVPDPGTTVTLRVATPVGPISVVGEIVSADAELWLVRRRDGQIAEVSVASIEAQRVVPPRRSATTSAREIAQIAAFGWRAAVTMRLGDWLLRASSGFTQRANSALALGDPGMELDRAIDLVTEWYAERGLPALVMEPDGVAPRGLSERLRDRGWAARSETHVMTGEIAYALRAMPDAFAGLEVAGLEIRLDDAPDDAWYACYAPAKPITDAVRAVIETHPAVVFASLRDGDEVVATARATVDVRWAGLAAVMVAADRRRQGLGAAVTLAASKEAARRGGRHLCLSVEVGNAPAIELYRRLNLRVHHNYRYWSPTK